MSRPIRQTLIRAVLETTYGTPPAFTAADALLVSDPSHRILRSLVDREIWFPHLGASEQLVAARVAEIKFSVELAGSGTAGTAPAWGKLLRGCGFAETITAGNRVEYNPVSDGFESLTFQYFRAGVRYFSRGARGTAKLMLPAFGIPKIEFTFLAFDTNAIADTLAGNYNLSAWRRPQVLTDANAGDIRMGGVMDLSTPVDHADPYTWAAVALAHLALGLVLVAVVAAILSRLAAGQGSTGRAALALVSAGYLLTWEIGVQQVGAGWADALTDTAMVAAGGALGVLAWRRDGRRIAAVIAVAALVLLRGIRSRR